MYSGCNPSDVALERELELADQFEDGEETPHLLNFENPTDLRKLLTERRLEVLRSINATPPTSIRDRADRLGRAASDVQEDVHLLADYKSSTSSRKAGHAHHTSPTTT
jgi:predicted transcriptional regulator